MNFVKGENFMIEIYLWKYLAEFEKFGTLSEAAKNLNLSQSAISRSMQKLEQIIDVKLFERTKNSIDLNDNGKLAAEFARKILTHQAEAIEYIREFDRKNRTISLGSCAPVPMNEIIFILSQNFPDISITSELNNDEYLLKNLQNDLFHLVVLHKIPEDKNLYVEKCGEEKLFLAIPPNHKISKKDGVYLEELNDEKVLLYSKIGFWYDICKEKAPNAKFLIQNDREIFKDLTEAAAFLSFTTSFFLENGYFQKNYVYKPVMNIEADVTYYCVCRISQKKRFQNLFADFKDKDSLYKKISYRF